MSAIKWRPAMSVKIKQFDDQHMKLVDMVNELHEAMKAGRGNDALHNVLSGLISYTVEHFAGEELLMEAHDYPETPAHKAEHERLVMQVLDLQKKIDAGQPILTLNVMMFLKDWLMNHIQGEDKKYGAYLNSKGIS